MRPLQPKKHLNMNFYPKLAVLVMVLSLVKNKGECVTAINDCGSIWNKIFAIMKDMILVIGGSCMGIMDTPSDPVSGSNYLQNQLGYKPMII